MGFVMAIPVFSSFLIGFLVVVAVFPLAGSHADAVLAVGLDRAHVMLDMSHGIHLAFVL